MCQSLDSSSLLLLISFLGISTLEIFWVKSSLVDILNLVIIIGLGYSAHIHCRPEGPSNIPVLVVLAVLLMGLLDQVLIPVSEL